jgi:hypothetical protein
LDSDWLLHAGYVKNQMKLYNTSLRTVWWNSQMQKE